MTKGLFPIFALCLLGIPSHAPAESFCPDFSQGIPLDCTIIDADCQPIDLSVYANVGDDPGAWIALPMDAAHGVVAASLTRHLADAASEHWLVFPPVAVESGIALQWQAHSMHAPLAESYKVMARAVGEEEWTLVEEFLAESHSWTTHALPLDAWTGKQAEIAFVATSSNGFMLALSDIVIGIPQHPCWSWTDETLHFLGTQQISAVCGSLRNNGAESSPTWVELLVDGELVAKQELPSLALGESIEISIDCDIPYEKEWRYELRIDGVTISQSFLYKSAFPRKHFIDRCSGLWCNNCPLIELELDPMKELYRDQIIVADVHVNDCLAQDAYWNNYLSEICFAVPMLVANHDPTSIAYSLKSDNDYSQALCRPTICQLAIDEANISDDGTCKVKTRTYFDSSIDNVGDRYRIGYALLADIHDGKNRDFRQSVSALLPAHQQFHYMSDPISPKLMYFENVPVSTIYAVNGVAESLPQWIEGYQEITHEWVLDIPETYLDSPLKLLAIAIDGQSGEILNADMLNASRGEATAQQPTVDDQSQSAVWYNAQGQQIPNPTKGLCLKRIGNTTEKRIIR